MSTKTQRKAPAPAQEVIFPSAFNLFKPSMYALWRNFFTVLEGMAITALVVAISVLAVVLAAGDNEALRVPMGILAGIAGVVAVVLLVILNAGLTALQVKSSRGEEVSLTEAYEDGKRLALRILGVNVLMGLIFLVSLALLIVPFFFMMRRYYLAPYFLVDRNLGVIDSLKASARECRRFSKPVWGLVGVEMLIAIVGYIPFLGVIVGVVVNVLYWFAPAVRYVQLDEAAKRGKVITGVN